MNEISNNRDLSPHACVNLSLNLTGNGPFMNIENFTNENNLMYQTQTSNCSFKLKKQNKTKHSFKGLKCPTPNPTNTRDQEQIKAKAMTKTKTNMLPTN